MRLALVLLIVVAVLVWLRGRLLRRLCRAPAGESFDGVVYRVGRAAVAERTGSAPYATVICMHGFVENGHYFTRFYRDPGIQLILLASADYHMALTGADQREASWAVAPDAAVGSIEYDAMVLLQALERLPRTGNIRVHGHSRGGAVVLEAAARRPDLFADVEVVLEAPVLPQAKVRLSLLAVILWWLPLLAPLWRAMPLGLPGSRRWGRLDDPRKRALIADFPFNARDSATLVANLHSIGEWIQHRKLDIYRNVARGVILIPDDDRVLDTDTMRQSAQQAAPQLRVIEVDDSSHFILLDRPDLLPPLRRPDETQRLESAARQGDGQ